MAAPLDTSREMRLAETTVDSKLYTALADLYCIMRSTELLESAYVCDEVTPAVYTEQCKKLINQFTLQQKTVASMGYPDINVFMKQYNITLPQAYRRLVEERLPATANQLSNEDRNKTLMATFYTAAKLFVQAVDAVTMDLPAGELIDSTQHLLDALNRANIRDDWPLKVKFVDWLRRLRDMHPSDHLSEADREQLRFDITDLEREVNKMVQAASTA